jgi:hypothetical protein
MMTPLNDAYARFGLIHCPQLKLSNQPIHLHGNEKASEPLPTRKPTHQNGP